MFLLYIVLAMEHLKKGENMVSIREKIILGILVCLVLLPAVLFAQDEDLFHGLNKLFLNAILPGPSLR
jgi:hypothetical protein